MPLLEAMAADPRLGPVYLGWADEKASGNCSAVSAWSALPLDPLVGIIGGADQTGTILHRYSRA
jgi:hypothetical protein